MGRNIVTFVFLPSSSVNGVATTIQWPALSIVCIVRQRRTRIARRKIIFRSFFPLSQRSRIVQISHISHFIMLLSSLRLYVCCTSSRVQTKCAHLFHRFATVFCACSLQLSVCLLVCLFVRLLNSFINISFYCWRLWVFVWLDWMRMRNEKLPMINTRFSPLSLSLLISFPLFVLFFSRVPCYSRRCHGRRRFVPFTCLSNRMCWYSF